MAFLRKLTSLYERQLVQEKKAAELIKQEIKSCDIPFFVQRFATQVPVFISSKVVADGKLIPSFPTSFVSGTITDNHHLVSSLISSQRLIGDANINFNPVCNGISRSNHYFAPSVAVSRDSLPALCKAKKIRADIKVKKQSYTSENILIGNRKNPKNILVCHYDSFGPGAIDNASGTTVLLNLAITFPSLLGHTLFVIGGNEELSYDQPIYWGRGYRMFEKNYTPQLQKARAIYVVDCVGNGKTTFDYRTDIARLGFPIKNLERWQKKIALVYGDFEKLMKVYHSDLDTADLVNEKYLDDATQELLKRIASSAGADL